MSLARPDFSLSLDVSVIFSFASFSLYTSASKWTTFSLRLITTCLKSSFSLTSLVKLSKKRVRQSSRCSTTETNLARNHEVLGSLPGLAQWVKHLVLP